MHQHLIPSRQQRPSDDLIFALNGEANRRRAAGESVVNATLGTLMDDDGQLLVLESAARALREVPASEWAAYAPIAGTAEFRAAVVEDCFGDRPDFSACATAVATTGGTGAIRHAIANYLEPGQAVATTSSFWGPYETLCAEQERRLETFAMFDAAGDLDVGALGARVDAQLEAQGRVLLFVNDPCHNPTGFSMSEEDWAAVVDALLRRAERGPITLLVDMAYYLYGSAPDPRAFLDALRPLLGRVGLLFAWSASKSFTHYGLRIGALVACVPDPAFRAATAAAFSHSCRGTWSNCNRGGMALVTRLLAEPALRAACDRERAAAKALLMRRVAIFNEHARGLGLRHPRYEGGYFVSVFDDDAVAQAARMRERHGVFVVPQTDALRVALCAVGERDIPRLAEALAG